MPEIAIIIFLVAASSFFSVYKQALKNVKKSRLQKEAGINNLRRAKRYSRVIDVAENPGLILAATRSWSWTLRIFAAAYAGFITEIRQPLPVVGLAAALIFTCLIFGELIPWVVTRREPERIAAALLPVIKFFALPFRPLYFFGNVIFKWLHLTFSSGGEQSGMTEDELHLALVEGEKSGIVESKERSMVEGVFYLGDRPLGAFMTHRSEIQWIDINATMRDILASAIQNREQRCFPVADGAPDEIIGAVFLEDLIIDCNSGSPAGLRSIMKKPLFVPETMPAIKAFESFKQGEGYFLFVMDEYGGFAGMVSLRSLMEEIAGGLASAVNEKDGSWLADGSMNIDDAAELLSLPGLAAAGAALGDYHTLAGFVLSLAGELPHAGDSFTYQDYKFTVLDMDGNRINKIEVKKN